eukprot:365335-Chlamydomonas_euryale.AAC.3
MGKLSTVARLYFILKLRSKTLCNNIEGWGGSGQAGRGRREGGRERGGKPVNGTVWATEGTRHAKFSPLSFADSRDALAPTDSCTLGAARARHTRGRFGHLCPEDVGMHLTGSNA